MELRGRVTEHFRRLSDDQTTFFLLLPAPRRLSRGSVFFISVFGVVGSAPARICGAAFCPPDATQLICQMLPHAHTRTRIHTLTHACVPSHAHTIWRRRSRYQASDRRLFNPAIDSAGTRLRTRNRPLWTHRDFLMFHVRFPMFRQSHTRVQSCQISASANRRQKNP